MAQSVTARNPVRCLRDLASPMEAGLERRVIDAASAAAGVDIQGEVSAVSIRSYRRLGDKDSNLDKRSQNPLSCR